MLISQYNPSMFIFKIEIHMHNILFSLMYSLAKGLENSDFLSFFQDLEDFWDSKKGQSFSYGGIFEMIYFNPKYPY